MTAPIGTKPPDAELPLPPLQIAGRAGALDNADPYGHYERIGRLCRNAIVSRLPADWNWEGRTALDFGCGAGRVLRQFAPEADLCDFHGCDIDEPAIAWALEHLSPPFNLFLSREMPPLERPSASFDLIWATSVFTHLVHETWSSWMLELHRLLRPGGILMASYLGERQQWILGEPWDDERVGMNVIRAGEDWARGGPVVFHSEWWLRAHWDRAFEILSIEEEGLEGQGLVVMRRRDVTLTPEELDRPELDEPRELSAAIHQGRQLYAEAAEQRRIARDMTRRVGELALPEDATSSERQLAREQVAMLEGEYARVTQSRSWRMTAPLRRAGALLRRLRARRPLTYPASERRQGPDPRQRRPKAGG
ncbi:MAG TPA: class I SAM-dependent methyltransferase [Thermoleophilaceae bacterium]|nr:class I SAM-dependent methyltransferase [Thermoleophilaceae bacterium]